MGEDSKEWSGNERGGAKDAKNEGRIVREAEGIQAYIT